MVRFVLSILCVFSFCSLTFAQVNCIEPEPNGSFIRGDANNDGSLNISDFSYIQMYLWDGGDPSCELDAADFNDDGIIDLTDQIAVNTYLFQGGDAPAEPFPSEGYDETEDFLFNQLSPRITLPGGAKPYVWTREQGDSTGTDPNPPGPCGSADAIAMSTGGPKFDVNIDNTAFNGSDWGTRILESQNIACNSSSKRDWWVINWCVKTSSVGDPNAVSSTSYRALSAVNAQGKNRQVIRVKFTINTVIFGDCNCTNQNVTANKHGASLGRGSERAKLTITLKERLGTKTYKIIKLLTVEDLCNSTVNRTGTSGSNCSVEYSSGLEYKVCPVVKDICLNANNVDAQSFTNSNLTDVSEVQISKVELSGLVHYSELSGGGDLSKLERVSTSIKCEVKYSWAEAANPDPCASQF